MSRLVALVALVACLVNAGCTAASFRPRVPMRTVRDVAGGRADTLVVFLPGRKDRARVFADEGLLADVRARLPGADLVAADAHGGYYDNGTVARRLEMDVMYPARQRGYRHVVLVGVSLGGYGAIQYAMNYPGRVETLILLSPFVGAGPIMKELAQRGDDGFAATQQWLERYPRDAGDQERARAGYPRLLLGFGKEDTLRHSDDELAARLPADDVFTTTGSHEWRTWRQLLDRIVERKITP